ncbi:thiopurine S-methyltransferase [Thiogranum longum]|uniref:Thiopurine S-methyltransferase n=1 Tax=Thiogranum longum TaxID=1537524 RepID=A0A4R1HCW0_9GAMM|nr:thiopurine S-methyltransferase [Thiogranum longum]TCK18481.1 thiopurine S-methyltransferase [Thiogranum longum]
MEPEFWHQRWRDNLTGFHLPGVNPQLEAFWSHLPVEAGDPVFVPLCGKSLDMLWLAERHPVTGVELSPIAVEAFFEENDLQHRPSQAGRFSLCESERIRILCGDLFDLQPDQLADIRAVYDRASLIALPPDMRPRYVSHLESILPTEVDMLLITLDYPQEQMGGPPFAVSTGEVADLFGADWSIEHLHEDDVLAREARFRERGISHMTENVFHLQRR